MFTLTIGIFFTFISSVLSRATSFSCFDLKSEIEFKKSYAHKYANHNLKESIEKHSEIPLALDWRDRRILSAIRNQHLPQYCGACWAFSATSTVVDRMIVKYGHSNIRNIQLSVQNLISCSKAGTCYGGVMSIVFHHMIHVGIPDETCSPYLAKDVACSNNLRCSTCLDFDKCVTVTNYTTYKIHSFGYVTGEQQMMAEILKNGPITCSIEMTSQFLLDYRGGVFMDCHENPQLNHGIEIIGWGQTKDSDGANLPYWIGRNSYGTNWGENGYFKVPRSSYKYGNCTLGVESECSFPVVFDKPQF